MKKLFSLTLALVMSSTLLIGCAKAGDSSTSNTNSTTSSGQDNVISSVKKNDTIAATLPANVKSAGTIKIGVDDSYPPMEYRDDKNNLVGFDVDYAEALGKKLGVKIEWVPTSFDGIILSLKSNKFDMIVSAMSITDERKKEIGFTEPYIEGGPVIIVKKGNTSIKSSNDFNGKVIGVQLGTTGEEAVSKISGIKETKKYNKITEALQDLGNGRIEAVVADDQVGRYYVGLATQFEVINKMSSEPFGIAMKKEDTALQSAIQSATNELKTEGTLSKISEKWFKEDVYKQK